MAKNIHVYKITMHPHKQSHGVLFIHLTVLSAKLILHAIQNTLKYPISLPYRVIIHFLSQENKRRQTHKTGDIRKPEKQTFGVHKQ